MEGPIFGRIKEVVKKVVKGRQLPENSEPKDSPFKMVCESPHSNKKTYFRDFENSSDGSKRRDYYDHNGILIERDYKDCPDGSDRKETYGTDGITLREKKYKDGTIDLYDDKGIIRKKISYNSEIDYKKGKIHRKKILSSGITYSYNENGKIWRKILPNGTLEHTDMEKNLDNSSDNTEK